MVLWEYQDCGFNRYRYVAVGTTCEGCTALDGQIFSIDEAEPGVNFGTLHPHCDCKTEILDANGNAVYTISSVKKEEKQKKSDDSLKQYNFLSSYMGKSLRQLLMGNFTEDVTLLGTALQVIAGLLDLDLPLDLRDLAYDLTHWENTPKHIAQTAMDFLALLPVIGSLKYSDEVSAVLKTAAKHGDEAADVAKAATKHADDAADAAKAATKHADEAADAAKASTKHAGDISQATGKIISNADEVTYNFRSVDKAFEKHGHDFGSYPDGSNASKAMFKSDVNSLIENGAQKKGFYRATEGVPVYDSSTHKWAFFDADGNFVTAFKLSPKQFEYLQKTGVVK